MKPLPLPLRVAAGLVATAADRARQLPKTVTGLPVTVASQALQLSMRVQQQVTEMAIRGDNALSVLRPVEETPAWATFDEDDTDYTAQPRPHGRSAWERSAWDDEASGEPDDEQDDGAPDDEDPWAREARAVALAATQPARNGGPHPAADPDYPQLSIAQLRGKLRGFTVAQLRELLAYERGHENRDEFTSMLSRRIDTVRAKQ